MRHLLLLAALLVGLLISVPASAAPVIYPEAQPDGALGVGTDLSGFGSQMSAMGDLLVVQSGLAQPDITATVLSADSLAALYTVNAQTGIAVGEQRLAGVSVNAQEFPEVSLYELGATEALFLASLEIPGGNDSERLGSEMAVNQNLIAIVDAGVGSNPDVVLIVEIAEKDGLPNLNGTARIETGLAQTRIALDGERLLVSGVPALGNVGHVVMYDALTGAELDRVDNVGGGPVVVGDGGIFVQRNQFFAEPNGPWTMVEVIGSNFGASHEIPGVGRSLAASEGRVVIGDSDRSQVLVFERSDDEDWSFRFTQAYVESDMAAADQFGASLGIIGERVIVGIPGMAVAEVGNRGSIAIFGVADGPVGCTVLGTPGDDEKLTGTQGDDTICGLAGQDRILGFSGDDVLYGGEGDDALLGNAGTDILFGEDGDDILNGGDGDDLLVGGDGDDTGNGGAGDDRFEGGAGRDKGNGGDGVNICDAEQRFRC